MKIGFSKDGLRLNSKKFDPLNINVKGYGLESDDPIKDVDPFELLGELANSRKPEATKLEKIQALQSVMSKFK